MRKNIDISSVIVSSRVRLARNLEGVPFKTKSRGAFDAIAETIKLNNRSYLSTRIQDLSPEMSKALYEQHFISKELLANKINAVIVVKNNNKACVMLGEEDHMRIQAIEPGLNLINAFEEAKKIADDIAANHKVAFRADIGYITCCPTNLGCGMRASVMMFLPALTITRQIESIIGDLADARITVRGVYGEGSGTQGNMYQISNQACLGMSEQQILENVQSVAIGLATAELELQQQLFTQIPDEIIDQVSRAYGILTSAYLLSSAEAVDHLAFLKLGACLGIIRFKNNRILDDLFFIVQPATLTTQDERAQSVNQRDKIRATRVAEVLRTSRIK